MVKCSDLKMWTGFLKIVKCSHLKCELVTWKWLSVVTRNLNYGLENCKIVKCSDLKFELVTWKW